MPRQRKSCESVHTDLGTTTDEGISAGFAGAFIDRIVETKGLDAIDKYKAKQHGE